MALIPCSECDKQFSSLAVACPNCGCPRENSIPVASFTIMNQGKNAVRINRNAKTCMEICIHASQKLGYRFLVKDGGIKITGKNLMGSKPNMHVSFVEDQADGSTLLTLSDVSFTGLINRTHMFFPQMRDKFLEALEIEGSEYD